MPVVSKEYMQNKRDLILRCARKLCAEKTVSTVTMQDIINETGFSQGGIYRFYKNIDEIFRDMLEAEGRRASVRERVDQIFDGKEAESVKDTVHKIFELLKDYMTSELTGMAKLHFEFSILAMNEPQRAARIMDGIEETGSFDYLFQRMTKYLMRNFFAGNASLRVGVKEFTSYLSTACDGIEMNSIVNHCYKKQPLEEFHTPNVQFGTLETTMLYLLGCCSAN